MYQVDLHVHTPRSACYADKSVTAAEIVDAALRAGLDAIAVTDHHDYRGSLEVETAAQGTGLAVLPGVEVTTRQGHFLALFDAGSGEKDLVSFLEWLGIAAQDRGDGHLVVARSVESILPEICSRGGVAIAAHIERWPSGFLESKESRVVKQRIHASEYLGALEITIPADKSSWNEGRVRGFPKQYACVQGSDAHSLSEIGRRRVLLDVGSLDLDALCQAFKEHERRIAFPA